MVYARASTLLTDFAYHTPPKAKQNSASVGESRLAASRGGADATKKQNGKGKAEATDGGEGWESGGEDGRAAVRSGRQAVPTRKKLPVIILIAR